MKKAYIIFLLAILVYGGDNLSKANRYFFIENKGQWPEYVKYVTKLNGMTAWITTNGITYDYYQITRDYNEDELRNLFPNERIETERKNTSIKGHVVKMNFLSVNSNVQSKPGNKKEGYYNYFTGSDKSNWTSNVPLYGNVELEELYDKINVKYYFDGDNLRYDFVIKPGGETDKIKIKLDGTEDVKVNKNGELVILTSLGEVTNGKLYCYQEIQGKKKEVYCSFKMNEDNSISIIVNDYDKSKTLIIDPLVYSTYIGGSDIDIASSIAIDHSGNTYLTGETYSTNYPVTTGAYHTTGGGDYTSVFVTKLNSTGSGLIYSTYIDGSTVELGVAITIDRFCNAYVAGFVGSSNYPVTPGAFQTTKSPGVYDSFITKLNPAGNALVYSTYLGGEKDDYPNSIAIDSTGAVIVAGFTSSHSFPLTSGAFQSTFGGSGYDGFITKLNPEGSGLFYSTYLGGIFNDAVYSVKIDSAGFAYLGGITASVNFPVTSEAYQKNLAGEMDVFAAKLNTTGSGLIYSTFIGGSSTDYAKALAIDKHGNAYLTGYTWATPYLAKNEKGSNLYVGYPTTPGAFQRMGAGQDDIFVTKLNSTGSDIVYSTYLGGEEIEEGYAITVDDFGNAYVTGDVRSSNFPVTSNAFQPVFGDNIDVFITKLNSKGTALIYSTYFGGYVYDFGYAIELDDNKNVTFSGYTRSPDFPITNGAYQQTRSGDREVFVTRMSIPGKYLGLTSPLGGEKLEAGSIKSITWEQDSLISVNIQYSSNNGASWATIISDYPADSGKYLWTVPLTVTQKGLIKITSVEEPAFTDTSNKPFTVWKAVSNNQTPLAGNNTLNFGATNITLKLNVITPKEITATYYEYGIPQPGTLPEGINFISDYYWKLNATEPVVFNNGFIEAPVIYLRHLTDTSKVKWLRRTNSDSSWQNIGGQITNHIFTSTIPFNELGEYVIGSAAEITGEIENGSNQFHVTNFNLYQNYPNPFNPSTTISYSIAKEADVILKVYDILGCELTTLVNQVQEPGIYEVTFAPKQKSGVYFYRLQAGNYVSVKKMIFLK